MVPASTISSGLCRHAPQGACRQVPALLVAQLGEQALEAFALLLPWDLAFQQHLQWGPPDLTLVVAGRELLNRILVSCFRNQKGDASSRWLLSSSLMQATSSICSSWGALQLCSKSSLIYLIKLIHALMIRRS